MALTVGYIGGGRIPRIVLGGWRRAGCWPARVVVSDVDASPLESLRLAFPELVVSQGDNQAPAGMEVVLLAVHPPVMRTVLAEIRGRIPAESLVVSLAPKLTITDITAALGGFSRLARLIPNAPSIVGAGFNPVSFGPTLPARDRQALRDLMAPLGAMPEVAEPDLESYAVLTGMGPTYLWFQLYELLAIAEGFGLEKPAAAAALHAMVDGTLRTMIQSGLAPVDLMDLVPVKPLSEDEQLFKSAYRSRLKAVLDKIRPAVITT